MAQLSNFFGTPNREKNYWAVLSLYFTVLGAQKSVQVYKTKDETLESKLYDYFYLFQTCPEMQTSFFYGSKIYQSNEASLSKFALPHIIWAIFSSQI